MTGAATTGSTPSANSQSNFDAPLNPSANAPKPFSATQFQSYAVRAEDSYRTIAEKFYPSGNYYYALRQFNLDQNKNADKLEVGNKIVIPDAEVLKSRYPDLLPR